MPLLHPADACYVCDVAPCLCPLRFTRLLSAWHMHEHHDTDPRIHSDLLLGLALLQYPVPDYLLTSTLQAGALCHSKSYTSSFNVYYLRSTRPSP